MRLNIATPFIVVVVIATLAVQVSALPGGKRVQASHTIATRTYCGNGERPINHLTDDIIVDYVYEPGSNFSYRPRALVAKDSDGIWWRYPANPRPASEE